MRYYNFFTYGEEYFNKQEYEKALKYFNKFIKFNESMPEAYENKAVCYMMLNNISECVATYKYMIKHNIGNTQNVELKIQHTIGGYLSKSFDESNIDLVNQLNEDNTNILVEICKNNNPNFAIKLIIYIYQNDPLNLNKHYIHIRFVIETFCNNMNMELFKLKEVFLQNKQMYYIGLCNYFQGHFEEALEMFLINKNTPDFSNYSKDIQNTNNFFYISSFLRSSDGSSDDYEMITDIYNAELENGNTMIDKWYFFTVYNVYIEAKNTSVESFQYICKINQETINEMNMKLITNFEETNKIKIQKIDELNQIVLIKDCNIFTHKNGIIIQDNKNLYVGKNLFYPYTPQYITLKKEITKIKGKVFSSNICNQTNYFHIITELISRICILEKYMDLSKIKLVISNNLPSYGKEILTKFNFQELIYYDDGVFHCEEIVLVDIGIESDEYKDCWSCYLSSKLALDLTYERFVLSLSNYKNYVIYISRSNSNIRNIKNEEILIEKILKPLYGDDLIIFDHNYLAKCHNKFRDQVELFNNARLVIAPHGAGLTNILFCRENTPIVEFLLKPNCNRCFEYIAKYRKLNYIPVDFITSFYHTSYTFEEKYIKQLTTLLKNIIYIID